MNPQLQPILAAHRTCCPWFAERQQLCLVQPGKPIPCNDKCKYMERFAQIVNDHIEIGK